MRIRRDPTAYVWIFVFAHSACIGLRVLGFRPEMYFVASSKSNKHFWNIFYLVFLVAALNYPQAYNGSSRWVITQSGKWVNTHKSVTRPQPLHLPRGLERNLVSSQSSVDVDPWRCRCSKWSSQNSTPTRTCKDCIDYISSSRTSWSVVYLEILKKGNKFVWK